MGDSKKKAEYEVFPKIIGPQNLFFSAFCINDFPWDILIWSLGGMFLSPPFALRFYFQICLKKLFWIFHAVLIKRTQSWFACCCCCHCYCNIADAPLRWSWSKVEIVTKQNLGLLNCWTAKPICWLQVVTKDYSMYCRRQARRMGSSCSKDPDSLIAFRKGFLKATVGMRIAAYGPSSDWLMVR